MWKQRSPHIEHKRSHNRRYTISLRIRHKVPNQNALRSHFSHNRPYEIRASNDTWWGVLFTRNVSIIRSLTLGFSFLPLVDVMLDFFQ